MAIPLHPKRHLVASRNESLTPEQHQDNRNNYRKHLNPQQFGAVQPQGNLLNALNAS